jgi:RNA-binding protein
MIHPMCKQLTDADRRRLRGLGHHCRVVMNVGANGITDALIAELEVALEAHQLVKLRLRSEDRSARDAALEDVCTRVGATMIQRVGHVALLYRVNADKPSLLAPRD